MFERIEYMVKALRSLEYYNTEINNRDTWFVIQPDRTVAPRQKLERYRNTTTKQEVPLKNEGFYAVCYT